jgi:hypothetical protein
MSMTQVIDADNDCIISIVTVRLLCYYGTYTLHTSS